MGVAAVVHLYVFPAVPYKRGETCVRNVAVMTDCASLGAPPDPEEIVDDMKYTVSHVVEPVERGIAKINKTLHQISKNVKRHEEQRKSIKDNSYLIPLNSWNREFSEVHDNLIGGSASDSGITSGRRQQSQSKASMSRTRAWR
ncbi:hypothetical protein C1H46_029122 [Malus baccata]|uniref:Uncharacterized protein n=1 Tax=Malus baccata TaxID=106549 RepID=A0A540LFS0_MALBA|nr:hypothetical protein C1H46_029122 [Malus baccata]